MEQISDLGAFEWIAQGLPGDGFTESRLLPPVFAAYCKVFHAIHVDLSIGDSSLSWHEAADTPTVDGSSAPHATKDIVKDLVSGGTLERGVPDGPYPRARVLWRDLAARYRVDFTPWITDEASKMPRGPHRRHAGRREL